MSLSSLILALAPAIAARLKPKPNRLVEVLEAELAKARDEIAELRAERDLWRNRAYYADPRQIIPPRPAGPDFRPPELAQLQALQAQQAQLAAMNAPQFQQGLLGGPSLMQQNFVCNCVPARHDMFLRGE